MSYRYNQRRKHIQEYKRELNKGLGFSYYFLIDDKKKTFNNVNGSWKVADYHEPITTTEN
jgi:hypothetical protein